MRLTETRFHIDRRCLLAGAGAGLLSLMSAHQAEALGRSEATFVSTAQEPNGQHCVVVLGERGEKIASIPLPARGHDVTFDPVSGRVIVFARRPGTFAVLFAPRRESKPQIIKSAANRHFFGHGVFSPDGRLVYAAEFFKDHMKKPVAAYVAGLSAPKGKVMGHAGAIISAFGESAQEKVEIFKDAGVAIIPTPASFGEVVKTMVG